MKDSARWTAVDCELLDRVTNMLGVSELLTAGRTDITINDVTKALQVLGLEPLRVRTGVSTSRGVFVYSVAVELYRRGACEVAGANLVAATVALAAATGAGGEELLAAATALHLQGLVSEARWT